MHQSIIGHRQIPLLVDMMISMNSDSRFQLEYYAYFPRLISQYIDQTLAIAENLRGFESYYRNYFNDRQDYGAAARSSQFF